MTQGRSWKLSDFGLANINGLTANWKPPVRAFLPYHPALRYWLIPALSASAPGQCARLTRRRAADAAVGSREAEIRRNIASTVNEALMVD
jgi:hypothetical protein